MILRKTKKRLYIFAKCVAYKDFLCYTAFNKTDLDIQIYELLGAGYYIFVSRIFGKNCNDNAVIALRGDIMSFDQRKREEIRKYILSKVALRDKDFVAKTMDNFGVTRLYMEEFIREAIRDEVIAEEPGMPCQYRLIEHIKEQQIDRKQNQQEEDRLYAQYIEKELNGCNENARRIWQYTCAEILNNAIEHSQGDRICIIVRTNALYSSVVIVDNGVGIFQTLVEYMKENGWENPNSEDALIELYKGKITSDSSRHSGEGIFFSSKAMTEFGIWSDAKIYKFGYGQAPDVIEHRLLAYASRLQDIGTLVMMTLENETSRKLSEVFDMYTDIDEGFIRTSIAVKEACLSGEPVARSQARRICNRLDEFKEVILDFSRVEVMGQGFADEIFRVFALEHPQVTLRPVNMIPEVVRMIRHVSRGQIPGNICLPGYSH